MFLIIDLSDKMPHARLAQPDVGNIIDPDRIPSTDVKSINLNQGSQGQL